MNKVVQYHRQLRSGVPENQPEETAPELDNCETDVARGLAANHSPFRDRGGPQRDGWRQSEPDLGHTSGHFFIREQKLVIRVIPQGGSTRNAENLAGGRLRRDGRPSSVISGTKSWLPQLCGTTGCIAIILWLFCPRGRQRLQKTAMGTGDWLERFKNMFVSGGTNLLGFAR